MRLKCVRGVIEVGMKDGWRMYRMRGIREGVKRREERAGRIEDENREKLSNDKYTYERAPLASNK